MSSNNDLFEQDWQDFQLTRDCLKVARRTTTNAPDLLQGTQFEIMASSEAQDWIDRRRTDLEDYVLLAMWTRFERYTVDLLQQHAAVFGKSEPVGLMQPFSEGIKGAIEYWKFEDVLKAFSGILSPKQIGDAGNVKKYRDWIVHQNPNKPTPAKTDPATARAILSEIVSSIGPTNINRT